LIDGSKFIFIKGTCIIMMWSRLLRVGKGVLLVGGRRTGWGLVCLGLDTTVRVFLEILGFWGGGLLVSWGLGGIEERWIGLHVG
jgi:hypothetical protein